MEQLKEQIKVVVEARLNSQNMVDKRKALYDEFQTKHCEFFGDVVTAATVVSEAVEKLRELTLQAYAETGNKAPMLGVGIREVTKLDYDPWRAFEWAIEHKLALKLDDAAFKNIVKASPLPFVKAITELQTTIATQLEEVK